MVRIADLIKSKTPTPATTGNGQADAMRFSGVAEHGSTEAKTTPLLGHRFAPESRNLYLTAQNYIREVREILLKGQEITLERPLAMIDQLIDEPSLIDEIYHLTLECGNRSDMYIASPVNSMIYSFKIGARMGYTPAMLTEISLAALHHDIGMYLIPEAITRKDGKLTDAEFSVIKKHTETGRDCFAGLGYPNVGRAIYEHHERESGQGYPVGLKGEEICEYAKIIGICDSYEAMTHDRPHKKAAAQYLSVLQLAGSKDLLFAPHIVKIFLDEITLYPIGSYVRLNNKAIGVVVETNRSNPLKPTIRIVVDGHGNKVTEEKLINLAEHTILTIVAGVAADEIAA
jgi:HD-GYP domain-containing protein (c-di-GMP phosphodiesterase class II)